MRYKYRYPSRWRKYQEGLQKSSKRKHYLKKLPFLLAIAGGLLTVVVILLFTGFRISNHWSRTDQNPSTPEEGQNNGHLKLSRQDLAVFLFRVADNDRLP